MSMDVKHRYHRMSASLVGALLLLHSGSGQAQDPAPEPSQEASFDQLLNAVVQNQVAGSSDARKEEYRPETRELLDDMKRTREFHDGKPDPEKWQGFNKQAAEWKLKKEKDKKYPDYPYTKESPLVLNMYSWAEELSARAQKIIQDSSIPSNERFAVLRSLLNDVIMPLRATTNVQGSDSPDFADRKYFEKLIPKLPGELFSPEKGLDRAKAVPLLEAMGYRATTDSGDVAACALPEDEGLTLQLDPQVMLMQDASQAGSAPTKENYTRALKLTTLAMILGQMEHHKQIMGNDSPIMIPNACRERLGGDLPERLPIRPLDAHVLEDRFDALIQSNGLSSMSPEYEDAFVRQDIGDPKTKGFIGYSPFEKLHAAEAALGTRGPTGALREPAIDDRDAYETVLELRAPKLINQLKKIHPAESSDPYRPTSSTIPSGYPVYMPPPRPSASDYERQNKAIQGSQAKLLELLQQEDDPRALGTIPKTLIQRMDQANATDWREVVPEPVRKQLESTPATLPFPPAMSPPAYRTWAVRELTRSIESLIPRVKAIEGKPVASRTAEEKALYSQAVLACHFGNPVPARVTPCSPAGGGKPSTFMEGTLAKIRGMRLDERASGDFQGQLTPSEVATYERTLSSAWNHFSPHIAGAKVNEWQLMNSQVGSNPFAGLKLDALIQKHDAAKSGDRKHAQLMDTVLDEMALEKPVTPFLANRLLNKDEKKKFWNNVRDNHDASNANLFTQRGWAEREEDGIRYYEQLQKLASTRTLGEKEAMEAAAACHLDRRSGKRKAYSDELKSILQEDDAKKADLLKRIYEARENSKEQQKLFDEYAEEFPVADERQPGQEARKALLDMDSKVKRPLYKSLIQRAATQRYAHLQSALADLCNLNPDDHEKFKQLVLSTMKAQDKLNEQLGLEGMPKNVRDELDRMSDRDWKEMKISGLALGLFIGASVLLTFSTGGLAAPAVAAGAAALSGAMAIGSVGLGAVVIPKMWLNELPNAEERVRYAETFESLRLTNQDSVERLKGEITTMKRWGIGANILFSLPMVKPTAQFLQASSRGVALLAKASAAGAGTAERVAVRQLAVKAHQDAEAISAEYLFGYRKLSRDLLTKSGFQERVYSEAVKPLKLAVNTTDEVSRDAAKLYASRFNNDHKRLEGFLEAMKKKLAGPAARDAQSGPNFFRRMNLRRKEALKLTDDLLEALKHDSMQDVLVKKGDEFSELVDLLPRGKADIAAMVTIEGIPGLNTRLLHLKEISAARRALLRQLGEEGVTEAAGKAAAKTAKSPTSFLLKEFRSNLVSRGEGGEARWTAIKMELAKNLEKTPDALETLLGKGAELPPEAWRSPELRKAVNEMEEQSRVYTNVLEFDEWLAIKRLQKQVVKEGS